MPSPTATIRPTSADTRRASKSLSRSLMTSEISLVLMPTCFSLRSRQPAAELLQLRGHARVDDAVAVLQLHPAEDARVDDEAETDLLVEPPGKLACDAVAVLVLELDRRRHRCAHASRGHVGQPLELLVDVQGLADST